MLGGQNAGEFCKGLLQLDPKLRLAYSYRSIRMEKKNKTFHIQRRLVACLKNYNKFQKVQINLGQYTSLIYSTLRTLRYYFRKTSTYWKDRFLKSKLNEAASQKIHLAILSRDTGFSKFFYFWCWTGKHNVTNRNLCKSYHIVKRK